MTDDGVRFPTHDYPSDVEIWLDEDDVVSMRVGVRIVEFTPAEARDLGLALIELADAVDGETG